MKIFLASFLIICFVKGYNNKATYIFSFPVETEPVTSNKQANYYAADIGETELEKGKRLYRNFCASCHRMFKDQTGPAMAGTLGRVPDKKWIYDFLASPAKMIGKGDPYAVKLFERWKPTVMTAFPQLSNKDIDAIYLYAENEGKLYPNKKAYVDYIPGAKPKSPAKP